MKAVVAGKLRMEGGDQQPPLSRGDDHAIFIRAPLIESVGVGVDTLACLQDGTIVAARQGQRLVTSFHPELAGDDRFHRYFVSLAV